MEMETKKVSKYLSKTERLRFEALGRFDTIKAAAVHLGLDPQTLYNWLYKIKKRYKEKRGWINSVMAQQKRGGCLTNLLHTRKKMKPPDDLEEEDYD